MRQFRRHPFPTSITLSSDGIADNAVAGTSAGTLAIKLPHRYRGYAINVTDDAGGRFTLNGLVVERTATGTLTASEYAFAGTITKAGEPTLNWSVLIPIIPSGGGGSTLLDDDPISWVVS